MAGEFQWILWDFGKAKELPENAVHLGSKGGRITHVARVAVLGGPATTYIYGEVLDERGLHSKIIDPDGKLQKYLENYEILLAPKDGYYWVPNNTQLPYTNAFVESARYLARAYEETGRHRGKFYCGLATADTCLYQVEGRTELSSTQTFEILAQLPSFVMNEKEEGKDGGGREEHQQPTSELDTLFSFGWARWTQSMSTRFLVSAGTSPNGKSFVARSNIIDGILSADCIAIDTKTHAIRKYTVFGSTLVEVLLASPGSYMWVYNAIAKRLYEKKLTIEEWNDKRHRPVQTWDTRIRNSHDGSSREWDYRLGRFLGKKFYLVGHTSRYLCQPPDYSGADTFDCLIFMHRRDALDSSKNRAGPKDTELTRCISDGAIGWIPVDGGRHHSWAHAISPTEDHEERLQNKAEPGKRIIIRRTTIGGHEIEQMDLLELEGDDNHGDCEVLWGLKGSFTWVANHGGYMPHDAMTAGATSDAGLFYIGRAKSVDGSLKLGKLFPINISLSFTETDGTIKSATDYEILCVVNTPIPTGGSKRNETLLAFMEDLRALQRTELHGEGKYNGEYTTAEGPTYEDKVSSLMHDAGLEILLATSDWIPYVSRLARIHGLPGSVWPLLFRYIEYPCSEDTTGTKHKLKVRVASIIKYAVGGFSRKFNRVEAIYAFIPFLQHVSSTDENAAALSFHSLEALVTFRTNYEPISKVGGQYLESLLASEKLIKFINGCIDKLQVQQRSGLVSRLRRVGITANVGSTSAGIASLSRVGQKVKKLKRKSLASITASGGSARVPNTVVVTQLQSYISASSQLASKMELTAANDIPYLYQESGAAAVDRSVQEGQVDITEDSNAEELLEKLLEHPTPEHASALSTALSYPWSLPLKPAGLVKLQEMATEEVSKEFRNTICWAMLLSLRTGQQKWSETDMGDILLRLTPTLLKIAANQDDLVLTEAILTLLAPATAKITLRPTDFSHINEILELTITCAQSQQTRCSMIRRLAFSILCNWPNLIKNSATSTNTTAIKFIAASQDKTVKIRGTKYLALVTADHGQALDEGQLRFLETWVHDQVPDIRVYARTAFANGLWNNPDKELHAKLAEYFPQVFATYPVLLVAPGSPVAAEEFTEKINGRILDMVEASTKVPSLLWEGICKFLENCTHPTKRNSAETRRVLKKSLKQLSQQPRMEPLGKLRVAEKLFLKEANEDLDEDLVVECLVYIIKSIEKKQRHEKEEYQASERLLRVICDRMILRDNPVYPQCLHMLTSIQEIPQDIFLCYHLEMASLRLHPKQAVAFLKTHALDGTDSATDCSILAYHINNHFNRGLLVSRRTKQALISCAKKHSPDTLKNVWKCFLSMANAAYYFKEDELVQIFEQVNLEDEACKEACIKIIKNQGLPAAVSNKLLSSMDKVTTVSFDVAASLLETHQDPPQIVSHVVRIGIQTIQTCHVDGDKVQRKGQQLLLQVIPHINTDDIGELKKALLNKNKEQRKRASASHSYLEVILKLKVWHPQSVTWDEINSMAASEGPHLLSAQDDAVLMNIHQLWRSLLPVTSASQIFFTLISLQFGREDDLIESLCHYILVADGDRKEFHLKVCHTERLQRILQENCWAGRRVVTALQDSRGPKYASRLQQLGNSVFIAWSRAWTRDARKACEDILYVLVEKGWRLDSRDLKMDFRLLVSLRLVGANNLRIPDLITGLPLSKTSATDSSPDDSGPVAERDTYVREFVRKINAQCEVKNLCTKVLCYLSVASIYDSLKEAGKVQLRNRLAERIIDGYDDRRNEREEEVYLYLERIRYWIKNNPAVLDDVENSDFARVAQVFYLGGILHDRFEGRTKELNKFGNFILASKLLHACFKSVRDARFYIAQVQGIRDHEEVSSLIEMVQCFYFRGGVTVAVASPQPVDTLQVELALQYFWKKLRLCDLDRFPDMESKLRTLLQRKILSWEHFSVKFVNQASKQSAENLDSFFRLILNFGFTNISVDLLHTHDEDSKKSERFQSKVLGKLLAQHYSKGMKESRTIVKELWELNKHSTLLAKDHGEDSLLEVLRQVRGAQGSKGVPPGITKWSKEEIEKWAKDAKEKPKTSGEISIVEFLAVAGRAVQLVKGWQLTDIQIISAYLALTKHGKGMDGKFFQVSTGLGKSVIISIVAAGKVLLSNLHVDVQTHNPLLAKRDAEEWSEFYQVFQIRCSHNVEENLTGDYVRGEKRCYASAVVYGDTRQFQFDALRTDYLGLGTRGRRPYQCAILDEVDSIYIDDAEKLTVLSSPISGMELLQPLYHRIWDEACALNDSTNLVQIQQNYFTYEGSFEVDEVSNGITYKFGELVFSEEKLIEFAMKEAGGQKKQLAAIGVHDRRTFLRKKLTSSLHNFVGQKGSAKNPSCSTDTLQSNSDSDMPQQPRFSVPKNLERFVESQVENWAESALTALALEEEKHYVILDGKKIVPLDVNNGTTMEISSWSNGLHQFLQIKHGLEFNPETLQTAYLSNKAMMDKYLTGELVGAKGELIGFSGTLHETEDFFCRVCNTDVVKIPDLYHSCFCQFPEIISTTQIGWTDEIATSVEEQTRNSRAVLVICKSIKMAKKLEKEIEKKIALHAREYERRILLHVRSHENEDRVGAMEDWKAEPGDVIITTLLGARGMDIKAGEIQAYGGLHVILTFLLANKRLEAQALGRTARQGNYGSAQYILKVPGSDSQGFETLVSRRERQQWSYMESLDKVTYKIMSSKDEAFRAYVAAFRSIYQNLLEKDRKLSEFDWTLLDAYQEYWAIHFATVVNTVCDPKRAHSSGRHPKSAPQELRDALIQFVRPEGMAGSKSAESVDVNNPKSIFDVTQSCFLATRYAFHYYRENKFLPFMETTKEAKIYFQMAVNMDPTYASGAHAGLAYLALLGDKRLYKFPVHVKGYKGQAIRHLQKALDILTVEFARLEVVVTSSRSIIDIEQTQQKFQSPYEIQLNERLEVLKRYAGILVNTRDFVQNSLRPVYITSSSGEISLTHSFAKIPNFRSSLDKNASFSLNCHGLRWKKNVGKNHEVERALSTLNKSRKATVTLSLAKQNASKLKTVLTSQGKARFEKNFFDIFAEDGVKLGGGVENVKVVTNFDDIKAQLAAAKEIFVQLCSQKVMSLLTLFGKLKIGVDSILFHELTVEEATSTWEALPKSQYPIAQLSLCPFSDLYATAFKPHDILRQLKQRGVSWVATFHELGSVRRSSWLAVATICLAEVIAASALFATGAWPCAIPLLLGGAASDLWKLITSYFCRDFSWKSYGVAKILGIAIGLEVSVTDFVSSLAPGKEMTEDCVEKVATKVLTMMKDYGPSVLKLFVSIAGGPIMEWLYKKERDSILSKVQKVVEKELKTPEVKELLGHFRAIKRLECGESINDESLSQFFQVWVASTGKHVKWKLEKLKETVYGTLAKQAFGLVDKIEFDASLLLTPLIVAIKELITNHVNAEDVTRKCCEALQTELEKYVRRYNLRYILISFTDLTEDQVVSELRIDQHAYPPFTPDIIPRNSKGLATVTEKQIEKAREILKVFQGGQDCKLPISQFASSLSNFITDHIIGVFSGVVCDQAYAKVFAPPKATGTSDPSSKEGESVLRIPFRRQPEASGESSKEPGSKHMDALQMEMRYSQRPIESLSAWIKHDEISITGRGSADEIPSAAAEFLSEIMLFCIVANHSNVWLVEDGDTSDTSDDTSDTSDDTSDSSGKDDDYRRVQGYVNITYKLNEKRSQVVRLTVNDETPEGWDVEVTGPVTVYTFLSKIFGGDAQSIQLTLKKAVDSCEVKFRHVQQIVHELIKANVKGVSRWD